MLTRDAGLNFAAGKQCMEHRRGEQRDGMQALLPTLADPRSILLVSHRRKCQLTCSSMASSASFRIDSAAFRITPIAPIHRFFTTRSVIAGPPPT